MNFKKFFSILTILLALLFILTSCNNSESKNISLAGNVTDVTLEPGDVYAKIEFDGYGEIVFKLFPEIAPVAVERFITLAERGYYDSKNIHRVIGDFIIQGGSLYGDGEDGEIHQGESFDVETSEYARNFYGALCMASDNDGKNSYQFYIVNNKSDVDIDADIEALEEQINNPERELKPEAKERYESYLSEIKSIPENIRELYKSKSGVFRLDGNNTVFGQMIEGREVLDAISQVEVVSGNQIDDKDNIQSKPLNPIIINNVKIIRIPLPEPTTIETEETTKKGRKPSATTTREDDPAQLTEVVAFGSTVSGLEEEPELFDIETEESDDVNSEVDNNVESEEESASLSITDSESENVESNEDTVINENSTDDTQTSSLDNDEYENL